MVSPVEPRVTGDAIAMLARNQSHPVFVADHLAKPRAFAQSICHTAGEVLLLLGLLANSIRAEACRRVGAAAGDLVLMPLRWPA